MKPILYNATETLFDSYGLGEIDANKATATREKNGNYSLYIEYPVGGSLTPLFKQDMRIKSDAGVRTKNQTFYISRIVKDSSHVIKIYAKHISHLTETMGIVHGTIAVGDANAALSRWSESLVGGVEFRTWSDIETEGKTSWTVDKFKTAREALGGVEGSILDFWGGEYEFDNTTIRLHKQLGRKTPTVLQYGRNILSAEEDENSESSYTSIYPYASYTPEADEGGRQADPVFVTLPEKIVDSQWVKMYADRRVQVVDFSSKFAEKETPTLDKLRKMAERYVHDNRIGIPKMSIKVEYVDLAKTLDYADMAFMEEVELCDIVPIFYPKIGLTNEDGKVVVVNYDVLNDRNESIEIGTIGQGMKSAMVGSLGERLEALENRQTRLESNIPAYLLDGKGNKVWYQTPDNTREHKVGDTWFEKNGLYDRIYVWNGEIWEKRIDTEDVDVIAKEIDNKFKDFKSSTKLIEQKAEEALQNAGASTLLAQEAKQIGLDSIARLEAFKSQTTSAQTALSGDLDALKRTIANDIRPKQAQAEAEIAKQVEALVQTKKELAGVKSAQATYEETTTRRLSELTNLANGKASKSELVQTAEELASRIASVRVGGRNYYRDSEKVRTSTRFFPFPLHPYFTQENVGETWTLSFDLKINEGGEIRPLHFYHYQTNRFGIKASGDITPSKEWQRFTFTGPVIFPNDDPRYSRGEMALYDYGGNNNYSVRRIKFEKGTLATDWSPAIEDTDGLITEAKAIFERTAQGLRTDLSAIQEYANKDGQRQEALQRYSREESARQATAVRELVTRDYVGKATYQEDVKGINQKIEAVKTSANKDIASQIASYRQSVDGKFTDISSQITTYKQDLGGQISGLSNRLTSSEQGTTTQISNLKTQVATNKDNAERQMDRISDQVSANKANADSQFANVSNQLARKVETTDFQRVKETSQLYERILGNTENGIADKVARMAMTNQLFQVEVGKAFAEHQNLFLNSTLTKGFLGNNGIINVANAIQKEVTSDFISVYPNEKIIFQHWVTLPENGMAWTAWQFFDKNKNPIDNRKPGLNAYKTTVGKQHNINQITVPANAYFVRFSARMYDDGLIKVEKGSAPSNYSVAPNDAIEAVKTVQRQLDGSWSVQNINSAGDIISGVNLGADGINRFIGKLTHITGETLFDRAVIKSAMIADAQINTAHIDSIDAANGRIINLTAKNFTANRVEGLKLIGGDLSATNGAMKIDLNKGQYEVYTEKAALRRVVAGYPNQFIKFDTGIQDVTGNREMKSGVTIIGSNSDGSENGNNQTFAGVQIWNNSQQRNVNSIGDFLRVSNKGYGSDEKGWIIQTIDTPTIAPIVDKNKPETGKRSAIYSGDFYFINKWGQKVSLLGILERFIVNFNTIKDKRGILYTDFSELN